MNRTRSERTGVGMILGAGILWGTIGLFVKQLSERTGIVYCHMADDHVEISGNAALYLKGEINV